MSKKIILAVLILFLSTGVVHAENYSSSDAAKPLIRSAMKLTQETTREAKKQKMMEFKEKMAEIRDVQKKSIVERISSNIASTNTRVTNKFSEVVTRMSSALTNLKTKSASLKTSGKDTAALDSAIASAETAIANAKTALETQVAKEYTATITDESTLRNTIGQMVSQFRLDLSALHKTMINAKQALSKAVQELRKIDGDKTATGSANI